MNTNSKRPKGRVTSTCKGGLTEQRHAAECDIHNILGKQKKGMMITHLNKHAGTYGDYTNAPDFMTAQLIVSNAMTMFESIPADIRQHFGNDPAAFLTWIQNPDNSKQMQEWGFGTEHLEQPPAELFTEGEAEHIRQLAAETMQNITTDREYGERYNVDRSQNAREYTKRKDPRQRDLPPDYSWETPPEPPEPS